MEERGWFSYTRVNSLSREQPALHAFLVSTHFLCFPNNFLTASLISVFESRPVTSLDFTFYLLTHY
jgi:hypothetical protein